MGTVMMTDLRKVWRTRLPFIVLIVAVPGVLMLSRQWGYIADGTPAPAMPIASRTVAAPDFALRDLDGNVRGLASFRGRVVLLSFWATWCPPCRTELPLMERLYQDYKGHGFEVVAVSSDVQGAEVVQPFVSELRLNFTTLLDASGQVTRLYGVTSLPTSYLLDRQGRLVTVAIGGHDWAKADAHTLITPLLDAGPQAAVPLGAELLRRVPSTAAQGIAGGPPGAAGTFETR
jgi:peroxiredoxin